MGSRIFLVMIYNHDGLQQAKFYRENSIRAFASLLYPFARLFQSC